MIKSVQSGFAAITNNVTGDYGASRGTNITITSVDSSKCMVLLGTSFVSRAVSYYSGSSQIFNSSIKLTSNTNLQISISPATTGTPTSLRWQVIEFY